MEHAATSTEQAQRLGSLMRELKIPRRQYQSVLLALNKVVDVQTDNTLRIAQALLTLIAEDYGAEFSDWGPDRLEAVENELEKRYERHQEELRNVVYEPIAIAPLANAPPPLIAAAQRELAQAGSSRDPNYSNAPPPAQRGAPRVRLGTVGPNKRLQRRAAKAVRRARGVKPKARRRRQRLQQGNQQGPLHLQSDSRYVKMHGRNAGQHKTHYSGTMHDRLNSKLRILHGPNAGRLRREVEEERRQRGGCAGGQKGGMLPNILQALQGRTNQAAQLADGFSLRDALDYLDEDDEEVIFERGKPNNTYDIDGEEDVIFERKPIYEQNKEWFERRAANFKPTAEEIDAEIGDLEGLGMLEGDAALGVEEGLETAVLSTVEDTGVGLGEMAVGDIAGGVLGGMVVGGTIIAGGVIAATQTVD